MVRAMWRGVVLAESTETVVIEGNHYSPGIRHDGSTSSRVRTRVFAPGKERRRTMISWLVARSMRLRSGATPVQSWRQKRFEGDLCSGEA